MRLRLLAATAVALAFAGAAAARVAGDPLRAQEWWLSHVGADRATAPGPGVPIAIVDSGTDSTHPEFAGRPNTTYLNEQTVAPQEFHGTAVASVAAAPQNGVGIEGIYPAAALELFDASAQPRGITNGEAIAGINAVAQHCPAVIDLSFSTTDPDPDLRLAILAAFRNGCLVVASAGNGGEAGSPIAYPASWPHVFTVGATDINDQVAPFSNVGPATDLVAPGVDILAAVPVSRNPNGYEQVKGTSFSAAIVAAAAAWVWTTRPTLTVTQLTQLLRSTARDVGPAGFDGASGHGLLDIPAALTAATPPDDPMEPNDDIDQIEPGRLFPTGTPALTAPGRASGSIAGTLETSDDPRDLYRIWVPPRRFVHVSVRAGGAAAARIWGPKTVSVNEGIAERRRDLRGPRMYGGRLGTNAYVEVLLTGRSPGARYVLSVTAAKR